MTIPKEIVNKMKKANELLKEVNTWLNENADMDGTQYQESAWESDYYKFTDKPTGKEQDDGEYCEQHQGYIEDSFYGIYYYPTENGDYFLTHYEVQISKERLEGSDETNN